METIRRRTHTSTRPSHILFASSGPERNTSIHVTTRICAAHKTDDRRRNALRRKKQRKVKLKACETYYASANTDGCE